MVTLHFGSKIAFFDFLKHFNFAEDIISIRKSFPKIGTNFQIITFLYGQLLKLYGN